MAKSSKEYRLLVEYKNGMEKVYWFDSWKEAYWFVMNEGDHVEDWDINGK